MISGSKRARSSRTAAVTILILAALWVTWARAERPTIKIEGNHRFATAQLERLIDRVGWNGSVDPYLKQIQEAYIQEGHLFARIRVDSGTSATTLVIDEGEAARFGNVRIAGTTHLDDGAIRKRLGAQAGSRFKPGDLRQSIEALLEEYDAAGFPFAQVWMDSLQLDPANHVVDLTIYVVEGGSKDLANVEVEGLQKTRKDLAIKLSGLKTGEPYDGEKLREAYLRLNTSGIFDDVAYPTIRLSTEGQGVEALFRVVEPTKNNTFSAAFGYADKEGTQDKVLSGAMRLDVQNMGGSLRDLNVFWNSDGAGRTQTRLAFRQGFFLGKRLTLGLSLEQTGLDTVYTWQSLGLETGAPIGRLAGGLFSINLAVNGDRNTFSVGDVSKTLRLRLQGGFSFIEGKRARGMYIEIRNRHAYAIKELEKREGGANQSVTQYIADLHALVAGTLFPNLHITGEINFRNLSSAEAVVPLSEQFYLGGAATVRGYRENQFHGRRVAFTRSELLVGRSRLENAYLFADIGYILQEALLPTGVVLKNDIVRFGYGFGIRTQSKMGNIDISFGVGDELSLRQTKVHVILNRGF